MKCIINRQSVNYVKVFINFESVRNLKPIDYEKTLPNNVITYRSSNNFTINHC